PGRRSTRHRPSAVFPDRAQPIDQQPTRERRGVMPKFSGTSRRPLRANVNAPIRTRGPRIVTHEGGAASGREPESDLFLLAATNMVGEDTFYERAGERRARFADLVPRGTAAIP